MSGFNLAWFSFLSSERLCIFDFRRTLCIVNFFGYILSLPLVS